MPSEGCGAQGESTGWRPCSRSAPPVSHWARCRSTCRGSVTTLTPSPSSSARSASPPRASSSTGKPATPRLAATGADEAGSRGIRPMPTGRPRAIQSVGTLLFNVSTFRAMTEAFRHVSTVPAWKPDAYGSAAFLVSSGIAFAHAWPGPSGRLRNPGWWIAAAEPARLGLLRPVRDRRLHHPDHRAAGQPRLGQRRHVPRRPLLPRRGPAAAGRRAAQRRAGRPETPGLNARAVSGAIRCLRARTSTPAGIISRAILTATAAGATRRPPTRVPCAAPSRCTTPGPTRSASGRPA